MQVDIYLKSSRDPLIIKSDRIDIKDFENEGVKYKQIRYFKNYTSKSIYIKESDIKTIKKRS
ncbi:hypothetical protein OW763_12220 [Clostridium aestuarii]|uniref:Uncharacterized protein n=1 Tax=Clostridium aestuarii TaxID=338193 RepID=A0ABT4D1I2_9CLOT|nr:hypothetical protein [Clostridium aestuarii]MCY6485103.1 hypothetical protein [Clostridium aestuarii]